MEGCDRNVRYEKRPIWGRVEVGAGGGRFYWIVVTSTREANSLQHFRLWTDLLASTARRPVGLSRRPDGVRRIRLWTRSRSFRTSSTRLTHGT